MAKCFAPARTQRQCLFFDPIEDDLYRCLLVLQYPIVLLIPNLPNDEHKRPGQPSSAITRGRYIPPFRKREVRPIVCAKRMEAQPLLSFVP